jgi:hypothetical protein
MGFVESFEAVAPIADFLSIELDDPLDSADSELVSPSESPHCEALTEAQRAKIRRRIELDSVPVAEHVEWRREGKQRLVRWLIVTFEDHSGVQQEFGLYVDEISQTAHQELVAALVTKRWRDEEMDDVLAWLMGAWGKEGSETLSSMVKRGVHVQVARFLLGQLLSAYMLGESDYQQTLRQADLMRIPEAAPERNWLRNTLVELLRPLNAKTLNRKRPPYPTWFQTLAVNSVLFFERQGRPLAAALESARFHLAGLCAEGPARKTLHSWYLERRRASGHSRRRGRTRRLQ